MIVMVHGILDSVTEDQALVEVNGLTYGVLISRDLMERLITGGKVGQEVTLHTMQYIEGNVGMGNLIPRMGWSSGGRQRRRDSS